MVGKFNDGDQIVFPEGIVDAQQRPLLAIDDRLHVCNTVLRVPNLGRPSFAVMSLSCCDGLLSILETGVRWYVVGQGTLRAPDTRVTPPLSRHDRSDPLPSLGSQGAIDAVSQLHGSAPALVTALASPGAV